MTEKLSIAYVFDSTYKPAEGVARYIETLGEHFREQGHDVSYIVGESAYDSPNIYPVSRTRSVGSSGNHVDVPMLIQKHTADNLLANINPDVIHVQTPYGPIGWRFMCRANKDTAVVATFHTVPISMTSSLKHFAGGLFSHRSQRRFDEVISVSPTAREAAKRYYHLESTVIPCPVNIVRFSGGKRLPEYGGDKTNIVFMGRLEERKGARHLIAAISQIDPVLRSKMRVLIAGKGDLLASLEHQTRELGLDETVNFLGFVPDNKEADLFASADLAVFPATGGESFGIVLIDAIASGAGVVLGGNNPGYSYVLGDNKFLFDPRDPKALARKIIDVISIPGLKSEYHEQQKDLSRFDVTTVGSMVMSKYQEAIRKRKI